MSVTIKLQNFSDRNTKEIATLAADTQANSNSLTLKNNNNILSNDPIILGSPGAETTELRTVQSVSGATLATTDTTNFFHSDNSPVTALYGNQLKVYSAVNIDNTTPPDSAFSPVGNPIDIDVDQQQTVFIDGSGTIDRWYKYTFLNSLSMSETPLSDSVASRGGGYGQYVSIESIRASAGFKNNRNISDALIDEKRQAAQAEVNSSLYGLYQLPFATPVNALIENITRMIAVKYLLIDQYGAYSSNQQISIQINEAESQLKDLKSGQLTLIDAAGNGQTLPGEGGVGTSMNFRGWPNNTTATLTPDQPGAGGFMFERSMIDGYRTRRY